MTSQDKESTYLTTAEAASYLRYKSASAVRNLIQRGELKPTRRRGENGPYLFQEEELDRWLRECIADESADNS